MWNSVRNTNNNIIPNVLQENHIWDKLNFRAIKIIARTHSLETLVMLLIDTFLVIFSVYLNKCISGIVFMTLFFLFYKQTLK